MKVQETHLTYCTNVHAGESWSEVLRSLQTHVLEVKARVCPEAPFGVGLRLSARAARTLNTASALDELKQFLASSGLYVFTLNGFPYGPFHGQPVKEAVYRPDWGSPERVNYTRDLVQILGELLPRGLEGSISTVPGAFRPEAQQPAARRAIARQLGQQAIDLLTLREETGRYLSLCLEPEPCCMLETTNEAVQFFEQSLLSHVALSSMAKRGGRSLAQAEQAVREHLGICLDTCHAAIEFEQAKDTLQAVGAAGLKISKIQASTGLRLTPNESNLQALSGYDEQVYLHQVVARTSAGTLLRYLDLPQALQCRKARGAEQWRVHFHVPIHQQQLGAFFNTQQFLKEVLAIQRDSSVSSHIEVETYTWDVLPPECREGSVVASVARELCWVRAELES